MHDAKTHFSALVAEVQEGESIVIARAGKPVAKLTPAGDARGQRPVGYDEGLEFWIAPDFDEFVPPEFQEYSP
ncbi:MAG: type II toxin-antitoxin system Phd/YefM family antitoxin [Candidatus Tyrphobacter sp.]